MFAKQITETNNGGRLCLQNLFQAPQVRNSLLSIAPPCRSKRSAAGRATSDRPVTRSLFPRLGKIMPSIDWLTVYQDHPGTPKFGSETILYADFETGDIKREVVKSFQHAGSFDSTILVRSDGRGVEVSGNPSRWCREDNIWGFQSVSECLQQVYNPILESLGLPVFVINRPMRANESLRQGDSGLVDSGPVLRRVDICENYSVGGMDDAFNFLRYLAQASHQGKVGHSYPNGATVDWNKGSRYTYFKYYLKAVELSKRKKGRTDYLLALIEWARSIGLVRHELSLKTQHLRKSGLFDAGLWGKSMLVDLLDSYAPHKRLGASSGVSCVRDELLSLGLSPYRAAKAQREVYAYLAGEDLKTIMSSSAFYRLRSDLLLVGIDINAPLNVSALRFRVKELELRAAVPPSFYRSVSSA